MKRWKRRSRITSYNVCYTKLLRPQQDFAVITYPVSLDGTAFSLWEIVQLQAATEIAGAFGAKQEPAGSAMDPMAMMGGGMNMNGMNMGGGMNSGAMGAGMGQMGGMNMGQIVITSYSIHYTKLYEKAR